MSDYWSKFWNEIEASKNQKSVGRTKFGKPVNDSVFNKELKDIVKYLEIKNEDVVLDLCSGNGLITKSFYRQVKKVIAIDFSRPLLNQFAVASDNIELKCANLTKFDFGLIDYDKVVWYFAIQHFSLSESAIIIKKILDNLKSGGILLIGDIPNIEKKWDFYSKPEYQKFYFEKLIKNKDHIGTWFQKDFFQFLLNFLGFEGKYSIKEKPEYHFNYGVRFDIIIKK